MRRTLSKSISIMFSFDFAALAVSSFLTAKIIFQNWASAAYICLITALITFAGLFVLFLKDNYKIREFNISFRNTCRLFEGLVLAHIPAGLLLYFTMPKILSLKYLLLNTLATFSILQVYRTFFHFYLFYVKKTKNVLIIGANNNARLIANEIINKKALKMRVIGLVDDTIQEDKQIQDDNIKIFSRPCNLRQIIKENNIDIIIVAISRAMEETLLSEMVFAIPHGVCVYQMPDFYEIITGKYFIEKTSINSLFYDYMKHRSLTYRICKRIFDITAGIIILTLTFPILVYIAVRVKLTDGGSPIYTQTRVGRGGKTFKMYKLRTMYINDYVPKAGKIADTGNQDKDKRVIPFCKFVRKARFDEIPQMINIIKGDMSIVGSRTEWEDLVKIYSEEIPYYKCRQWVRTGWTGWAQINQGHCVLNDDIEEKLQYDLYYLKHRNIIWEICILVKAVFMALGGRHG